MITLSLNPLITGSLYYSITNPLLSLWHCLSVCLSLTLILSVSLSHSLTNSLCHSYSFNQSVIHLITQSFIYSINQFVIKREVGSKRFGMSDKLEKSCFKVFCSIEHTTYPAGIGKQAVIRKMSKSLQKVCKVCWKVTLSPTDCE